MSNQESEKNQIIAEVYRLAQGALAGDLSQIEAEQLEQLVIQNEIARDAYASFILDTAALKDLATADSSPVSLCAISASIPLSLSLAEGLNPLLDSESGISQSPISFVPKISSWLTLFAAFCMGVISFYAITVFKKGNGSEKAVVNDPVATTPHNTPPNSDNFINEANRLTDSNSATQLDKTAVAASFPVAYLASAQGCEWGSVSRSKWSIGQPVRQGDEISLHEGIAEFRLAYNGISLSVEGPANLVMTSSRSLILPQGKMTVHVPPVVGELKLMAGGCRIMTADSEVGIQVTNNRTCVHVFSGKATVIPSPFIDQETNDAEELGDKVSATPITLMRGEAIEIKSEAGGDVAIHRNAADQEQFAAKLSMAGKLPVTETYIKAVKASKPLGYWRFEGVEKNKTIRNEVVGGCALNVTTDISLIGDDSNHVIDLGQKFSRGNLVSAQPIDSILKANFSVELWAKPSHYHRGFLLAFARSIPSLESIPLNQGDLPDEKLERNSFRLELQPGYNTRFPGTIASTIRSPLGSIIRPTCISNELYGLRHWQHIVAVKGNSTLSIYLNGKPVGSVKANKPMVSGMHLVVGRTFPSYNDFQFVGQMDELSVYDHALTSEEVMKHYRAIEKAYHPDPEI